MKVPVAFVRAGEPTAKTAIVSGPNHDRARAARTDMGGSNNQGPDCL